VYRSDAANELHFGCESMKDLQLMCTHTDYDEAYELCELLAEAFQLSIQVLPAIATVSTSKGCAAAIAPVLVTEAPNFGKPLVGCF